MAARLFQKNPLTMVGTLDHCWLFVYRTPVAEAQALLPRGLAAVTHQGFAFWNVVVCHVRGMRPRGSPLVLGTSFWQVSYRIYVRLHPAEGDPIDGIYFVRSDSDQPLIRLGGNRITDFAFHRAQITVDERGDDVYMRVHARAAPASVHVDRAIPPILADGSPFGSLEEAARLLEYKPFGIAVDPVRGEANVVPIDRDAAAWRTRPVHVAAAHWGFFAGRDVRLELCYEVDPVSYRWNRGEVYPLPPLSDAPGHEDAQVSHLTASSR